MRDIGDEKRIAACASTLESQMVTTRLKVAAYYLRGSAYAHLRAYDSAMADFDRAIWLAPDFGPAYRGRGGLFSRISTARSPTSASASGSIRIPMLISIAAPPTSGRTTSIPRLPT